MQPPLPPTTRSTRSLHLLRALLREASYLPDSNARTFFRRYIVNRFRAYQPAENASPTLLAKAIEKKRHGFGKRHHNAIIQERARTVQHKGRKGLNYLRRANNGDYPVLKKVLYFAYGRMGKRKYALLENLLRPDDAAPAPQPSPLQKLYYSNDRFLSFFDAPKKTTATEYSIEISDHYIRLRTAIKAQVSRNVALGPEIKTPYLKTPINNIWERPMPIRRARNNVRRWYAETMTRLLPPLPADEFDDLQAMADGRKQISLVKRRTPAVQLHPTEEPSETDQLATMVHDALVLEKFSKADECIHPRKVDARFMRRMYAGILVYCSKLEWSSKYNKWESVWGRAPHRSNSDFHSSDDLFAGVDEKGKLLKSEVAQNAPSTDEPVFTAGLDHGLTSKQKGKTTKEKFTAVPFYVDFLPPDHPTRVAADQVLAKKTQGTIAKRG